MILPDVSEFLGDSIGRNCAFKVGLTVEKELTGGAYRLVRSFRRQLMGIDVVAQVGLQYLVLQVRAQLGIFNRTHHLNPPAQVAMHPVGTTDINFFVAVIREIYDPAVLKKAADNAAHTNVLR